MKPLKNNHHYIMLVAALLVLIMSSCGFVKKIKPVAVYQVQTKSILLADDIAYDTGDKTGFKFLYTLDGQWNQPDIVNFWIKKNKRTFNVGDFVYMSKRGRLWAIPVGKYRMRLSEKKPTLKNR